MSKRLATKTTFTSDHALGSYPAFDLIDGRHPWQGAVPEGYVPYQVRRLERGKVIYFNFALAREMGLITEAHPDELTPSLQQKVLDTFAIQIINEYDIETGARYPKHTIKEKPYMATRYLQLQHSDKAGRTSGDGRGIWNGTFRNKGVTWDVSSRGTGVTCLAPGAVEADRPLKTGGREFGYGCGLADVSELMGSALLSEIFHHNGMKTERVLTIVDLGKGCGIGVRAAPNLIRPAHLFLYLKQGRYDVLKRAVDYMIQRQYENGEWKVNPSAPDRYRKMLKEIATTFARFGATLERNYVFAWMDWDGDNILANGGIIDYGSIRQFGLRHDQYRYDDVDRFSTNLNEQRGKARLLVEVFAQMVDYLETGKRRSIEAYTNHTAAREFDREFDRQLRAKFLEQVGLDRKQIPGLLTDRTAAVEELYAAFLVLEKTKTKAGVRKLPDGHNRPAVFNMRAVLREFPSFIQNFPGDWTKHDVLAPEELIDLMTTTWAKKADLKLRGQLRKSLLRFQRAYLKLVRLACGDGSKTAFLKGLKYRAEENNRAGRLTGNGAEFVIDELLSARRKGYTVAEIQKTMELFMATQVPKAAWNGQMGKPTSLDSNVGRLFQQLVNLAHEFQEDI